MKRVKPAGTDDPTDRANELLSNGEQPDIDYWGKTVVEPEEEDESPGDICSF